MPRRRRTFPCATAHNSATQLRIDGSLLQSRNHAQPRVKASRSVSVLLLLGLVHVQRSAQRPQGLQHGLAPATGSPCSSFIPVRSALRRGGACSSCTYNALTGSDSSPSSWARRFSKASERYFKKITPRTTCLYSAASRLLRSLQAASHKSVRSPVWHRALYSVLLPISRDRVTCFVWLAYLLEPLPHAPTHRLTRGPSSNPLRHSSRSPADRADIPQQGREPV